MLESLPEVRSQVSSSFFSSASPSPFSSLRANSYATRLTKAPCQQHTECNDARYKAAKADTIIDGITHLNKKAMKGATCKAKKQSCSRVSCSYNSAIFLCNENDFSIAPECKLVADYAFKVIQDCKYPLPPKGLYVNGQHFNESGSWNVVVRHDKC